MKTIKTFMFISVLMLGITTSVFVLWWNPTTWFQKKTVTIQQAQPMIASSTVGQDVGVLNVSVTNTKKDSEVDPLTTYVFNSYSSANGQLLVEGELLPTSVQTENYEMQGKVSVVFRCWKKEMYCTFSKQFYKWKLSPQLDLLAIKSWNNNMINMEGTLGDYPDCSKGSCSRDAKIIVDLEKSTAVLKESICGSICATDEYLIIGEGDGVHKSRADLPKPKVSLVDISF